MLAKHKRANDSAALDDGTRDGKTNLFYGQLLFFLFLFFLGDTTSVLEIQRPKQEETKAFV